MNEERWIQPVEVDEEEDKRMKLRFQVADVKKPLIRSRVFCAW